MQVKAQLRHLRIAPRKVRLVADLIRGKKVAEAKTFLDFCLKKGALPLKKLLDQALTSASHNFQLEKEGLWISEIKVDEGPKLKRWRARARGRAGVIQKKTSHISLVLEGERKKIEKEVPEVKKEEVIEAKEREKKAVPKPRIPKLEKEKIQLKPKKRSLKRIFKRKAF